MTGTITITDHRDHSRMVYSGPFDDEKQLRKLLFRLQGSGYELRVKFDDKPISEKERLATILNELIEVGM